MFIMCNRKGIEMAKFDYFNFSDGSWDTEFVAHAKKYSKNEILELCIKENDWKFKKEHCNGRFHRTPTIADIKERTVRWYPKVPEFCGVDSEGGCYSYCKREERGSFPVWVIEFDDLLI